ncbi:TPA: hypothetical protein ACMDT9_003945 [Vibrio parahaemolyticus]
MEESTVKNIDTMIELIERYKLPKFDEQFKLRINESQIDIADHNALLRHLVILIVYSQQAQSKIVGEVIESGSLDNAFLKFNVEEVSKLNPCDVVQEHWQKIQGIRQQTKVFHIVMLSRKISEVSKTLLESPIPKKINTKNDLDKFWVEFKKIKSEFIRVGVPFFRETTSLLHLLTSLGYDCIKPDSAVLKAARKLKFLSKDRPSDKDLIDVVKVIQSYSLRTKRIKPPAVLDLYLLVHGKQTEAKEFVSNEYYQNT